MEHLRRVWLASRERLPFRTPGSVPHFWDLLMLQLLRLNSPNLPCLYSTFHLEYPLVLSRFYLKNKTQTKHCHCRTDTSTTVKIHGTSHNKMFCIVTCKVDNFSTGITLPYFCHSFHMLCTMNASSTCVNRKGLH